MSEHTSQPQKDYEDRDIRLRPLVIFIGATLFITLLTVFAMYALFSSYSRDAQQLNADLDILIENNRPTNAVLEGLGEAKVAFASMKAEVDLKLNRYAWVDKENGVVQVPIERAKELVVASGLPVRQAVQAAAPEGETLVQAGERYFAELGCIACHMGVSGALGPSLNGGVIGREVELTDGTKFIADEAYIRNSILAPMSQIIVGYAPVMPAFEGVVTDEQLDALVAYIKSLADS
jgi:mono/diheme cytochrome c family protein